MRRNRIKIPNNYFARKACLIGMALLAGSFSPDQIRLKCFPEKEGKCVFEQGQAAAMVLRLSRPAERVGAKIWDKKIIFKNADQKGTTWAALLGTDLKQRPGDYFIEVALNFGAGMDHSVSWPIQVLAKTYPVEELTLPKDMAEFTPEIVQRINLDNKNLVAAMSRLSPVCYWQGPFVAPVPGPATGAFGAKRVINGNPRSPHTGTDFKADLGQAVRAPNDGKVSLVYLGYLTGNSLIIDHGCGLYSVYYHLSEIQVKESELVKKGELIAKAGSSGRASGPHLHFSVRLENSYVDPVSFLALSQMLDQEIPQADSTNPGP